MYDYAVYGGTLRSELELPGAVRIAPGTPDWTLHLVDGPPPETELPLLGQSFLIGEEEGADPVRLLGGAHGYRLTYPDTGSYDVACDGAITWYAVRGAPRELVRADVLGPVLALALHLERLLCLHGSAVGLDNGVVAFLGPKHHGKSTLALALVGAGARLATDDTLAVELASSDPAHRPTVRPGVHSVRLWPDSAAWLEADGRLPGTMLEGMKQTVTDLPADLRLAEPTVLRSVYVLDPAAPGRARAAVRRTRLRGAPAALALLAHAKLAPLLGGREAGVLLQRAAALAHVVPVYRLGVVHAFERLPDVVRQVMAWHAAERTAAAVAAAER